MKGWRELGGCGGEFGWWTGEVEDWDCCRVGKWVEAWKRKVEGGRGNVTRS